MVCRRIFCVAAKFAEVENCEECSVFGQSHSNMLVGGNFVLEFT